MRVRFFGVRGSIATPGASTVRYGGNTVCVEVRLADDTRIVLDAGTGIRECGKQIAEALRESALGFHGADRLEGDHLAVDVELDRPRGADGLERGDGRLGIVAAA